MSKNLSVFSIREGKDYYHEMMFFIIKRNCVGGIVKESYVTGLWNNDTCDADNQERGVDRKCKRSHSSELILAVIDVKFFFRLYSPIVSTHDS